MAYRLWGILMQPSDRIGRRLSLRDLNLLLIVIEKRSMSKAAAELAVSQPVVSKAIANMERVLGVPLLDRSPTGIEPTPYGRAIARRGVAAFDELRHYADMRIMPSRWPL